MGYPSVGVETVYRNPMSDTVKFLEYYHKDHYRVYNLYETYLFPSFFLKMNCQVLRVGQTIRF